MMPVEFLHYAAVLLAALAACLLVAGVFGSVRDLTFESEAAGSSLTEAAEKRRRLLEGNPFYALALPVVRLAGALFEGPAFEVLRKDIDKKLDRAGHPGAFTSSEILGLSLLAGGAVLFVASLFFLLLFGPMGLFFGFSMALAGFFYPQMWLRQEGDQRIRKIERYLPHALDLITLTLDGGANFSESLEIVVRDLRDNPLSDEFARLLGEIRIGRPRREALQALAQRTDSEDLAMVLRAAVQGEEMGSPLAEVFATQGTVIRQRRSNEAERYAGQAAIWILFPSTLVLFAIMLLILAPFVIKYFVEGTGI